MFVLLLVITEVPPPRPALILPRSQTNPAKLLPPELHSTSQLQALNALNCL